MSTLLPEDRSTQIIRFDGGAPYLNLVLAGEMGVGKREAAAAIAARFNAPLRDIDAEIADRAGMPPRQVRELFGEARLHNLESDLCRELALQRGAVIVASAGVLLAEPNRQRLAEASVILVLTTALNETLRRLHADRGDAFADPTARALALARLKREWRVRALPGLPHLDTTQLTPAQVVEEAAAFWRAHGEV